MGTPVTSFGLSAISCTRSKESDHKRVHALEALLHPRAFLADVEDLLLGLVQDRGHRFALRVEGAGGDLVAGADELAQDGALAHDLRVAPDIAGAGHILGQRVEIGQAAHLLRLAQVLQLLVDRDDVGRFGSIDQRTDHAVDEPVLIAVEVTVGQQVANPVPGAVVQQQSAEHAGFRLDGVRRYAQLRGVTVGI